MGFAPAFQRVFSAPFDRLAATAITWLLRDDFTTDRAAGSVNGTAAEPGPGTRTVVDTESKIAVLGGELVFSGGKASHAYGDPVIGLGTVSRTPGRTGIFNLRLPATTGFVRFGFNSSYSTASPTEAIVVLNSAAISLYTSAAANVVVGAAAATTYSVAFALRSRGVMLLIKGGAFAQWTLLYATDYSNSATLYSLISNYSYQLASGSIRVPDRLWLPTPLVSDGFASAFGTSDGLGHAEGIAGGIGAGGSGLTWSNAGSTWSVSDGKAINTAPVTLETDPVPNGNMEDGDPPTGWGVGWDAVLDGIADERTGGSGSQSISVSRNGNSAAAARRTVTVEAGRWYELSGWIKNIDTADGGVIFGSLLSNAPIGLMASSSANEWTLVKTHIFTYTATSIYLTLRSLGTVDGQSTRFDDVELRLLPTLPNLVSVTQIETADTFLSVDVSRSGNGLCGLAISWDDAENPQNGVLVTLNVGTGSGVNNIRVDKCVSGVWSNVSAQMYTYYAGAKLVVQKAGTKYRVYYNNTFLVESTISDASIVSNTLHGIFSTDALNSLDNLVIYATGTGGEYSYLDQFTT